MNRDRGNTNSSATEITWPDIDLFFACYDALPRDLRRVLMDANLNWNAVEANDLFRKLTASRPFGAALNKLVTDYRHFDFLELRDYGKNWLRETGAEYPHLAAGATFMRYNSAGARARRGHR